MSRPDDQEVWAAMRTLGGSFVERLAEAWRFADDTNRARLRAAFPDIWEQYEELATIQQRTRRDAK